MNELMFNLVDEYLIYIQVEYFVNDIYFSEFNSNCNSSCCKFQGVVFFCLSDPFSQTLTYFFPIWNFLA